MKRKLVFGLALLITAASSGIVFAAANPFVDVPTTHWSYSAIDQLEKEGLIDGYGTTFSGDRQLTRYEMARLIAKAVANDKKLTSEQKGIIKKLSNEYAAELENMGMKIDKMQEKLDSVKIFGFARYRYEDAKNGYQWASRNGTWAMYEDKKAKKLDVDGYLTYQFGFDAKLNNDWHAIVRMENYTRAFEESTSSTVGDPYIPTAWVEGPMAAGHLTVGKYWNFVGHGMVYDNDTTGIKYNTTLGKTQAMMFYGRPVDKGYADGSQAWIGTAEGTNVLGLELKYPLNEKTNLNLVVVNGASKGADKNNSQRATLTQYKNGGSQLTWDAGARLAVELSADTRLNKDLVLTTGYSKSNADYQNKNYQLRLDYKGANPGVVGSWGIWGKYAYVEQLSGVKEGSDDIDPNTKGYQWGFSYTPIKNTIFSVWWMTSKYLIHDSEYDPTNEKSRLEMIYFF